MWFVIWCCPLFVNATIMMNTLLARWSTSCASVCGGPTKNFLVAGFDVKEQENYFREVSLLVNVICFCRV